MDFQDIQYLTSIERVYPFIATLLGVAGYRKRTLSLTALTMGEISEFYLILAVLGLGHMGPGMVNLIIAVALITFGLGRYGNRMGLGFKQSGLRVLGIDSNPDLVRKESDLGFEARWREMRYI